MAADKKGARRSGRVIAFLDETGFTFRARVATTWAPVGHAPVLRRLSKRRVVSSVVAVTAPLDGTPPRLVARHFLTAIHATEVITALRYFRGQLKRPLLIVWDHLSAHRAKRVTTFLKHHPDDFQVEWLPGYAPELNPEELCNNAVKLSLFNAVPGSVEELRAMARANFIRLGHKPWILAHFFRYAGLPVN